MAATGAGSRLLGFDRADHIAVDSAARRRALRADWPWRKLFASQNCGLIVLPLMLFHQIQLMVCAALARQWTAEGSVLAGDRLAGVTRS